MKIIEPIAKDRIVSAVKKYIDVVAQTYGPAGKSVLLGTEFNIQAVDDGKTVSQDFELENEFENAIVKYIRETTSKTDDRVGDGTTTSAIIMADIVNQLLNQKEFEVPKNLFLESQKLKKALSEAVKQIKKLSKKIKTKEELYSVAYNSFNNEEIAKLISDALFEVGKDGSLVIEDSKTMKTECETVKGLEIEKGYVSPYFITKDEESVLNSPAVIVVKKKIDLFKEILPVINPIAQQQMPFVLIAEGFSEDVIGNFIVRKLQNVIRCVLVEAPGFGDDKSHTLKDIATITGGKVIDPSVNKFESITPDFIGSCETFTAKRNLSVIIGGKGGKDKIDARVAELKSLLEEATSTFEKEKLSKRIASLIGGLAVIRVGAYTENEQRTTKAKVEDAVNATKVAFREGVVPGAGKTFDQIKTSSEVLNQALKAPRKQLEANGKEALDENVTDPTEVLVASLESAVSIACGLINMGAIITEKRKKPKEHEF